MIEDTTVFTSLEAAPGFWQALFHENSSLPTTLRRSFREALPFNHLLFVINITREIQHKKNLLLEKAGGQSQVQWMHGNDIAPAEHVRENTAGCSQHRDVHRQLDLSGPGHYDGSQTQRSALTTSIEDAATDVHKGKRCGVIAEYHYSCPTENTSSPCWS